MARKKKKRKPREQAPMGGLELAGQALSLVRSAPPGILVGYFVGTLPFILGALYFWMDMALNTFAASRCFAASLVLALCFIWMKSWHTVYATGLRDYLAGRDPEPWTARRSMRMVITQLSVQPHGLWLLPLSLVPLFLFPMATAFFHNVGLMGDGKQMDLKALVKRANTQAWKWPNQNWVVVWLICPWILGLVMLLCFGSTRLAMSNMPEFHQLRGAIWFLISLLIIINYMVPFCPFGSVVAGNIALVIVVIPFLMHTWFGFQTPFTRAGVHLIFNSTFLMTVFSFSFLCLDPLIRAAYVIRCFHGEAETTGEDLLADLRAVAARQAALGDDT